jgi:Tfp pilus assembly protein PilN
MLRTNLSTRPFYNERAVRAGLLVAAIVVLALTVVNAVRIVTLSRQNTELSTQIVQEQQEAARLTEEAAAVRRTIDRADLQRVVLAAGEANALIDQRTFSWTEFFNWLETTLPPDVMLTSVRPLFQDEQIRINMNVLGRRAEDIDEFMERLEASGVFERALPGREDITDQGIYRVSMSVIYLRHDAEPEAAPEPAARRPGLYAPAPDTGDAASPARRPGLYAPAARGVAPAPDTEAPSAPGGAS